VVRHITQNSTEDMRWPSRGHRPSGSSSGSFSRGTASYLRSLFSPLAGGGLSAARLSLDGAGPGLPPRYFQAASAPMARAITTSEAISGFHCFMAADYSSNEKGQAPQCLSLLNLKLINPGRKEVSRRLHWRGFPAR